MRIAIVNDMLMAVEAMRRVVVSTREHQVAWVARDGAQAVELCSKDTPDLILMDLIMPHMDGVEATRRIMSSHPCPIVVVTANVTGNASQVFEAMGAGALDAVNTPVLEGAFGDGAKPLLLKIDTIRRLLGSNGKKKSGTGSDTTPPFGAASQRLVAIGASAGGPAALAKVLGALPSTFPAGIVIVQHVDVQFVKPLAEWLAYQTPLTVRLADEGDRPAPGLVLLAAREEHLIVLPSMRLSYTPRPLESSYRPSIDTFFLSAGHHWQGVMLAVILTGMGRDGAEGLLALRRSGHHTIAQDRLSSAVYGMPKAAAELDAADEILPLNKIGARLAQLVSGPLKRHG